MPGLAFAEKLPYLTQPLRVSFDSEGSATSVELSITEFKALLHHLQTLLLVLKSGQEESVPLEQFLEQLRADGVLQA